MHEGRRRLHSVNEPFDCWMHRTTVSVTVCYSFEGRIRCKHANHVFVICHRFYSKHENKLLIFMVKMVDCWPSIQYVWIRDTVEVRSTLVSARLHFQQREIRYYFHVNQRSIETEADFASFINSSSLSIEWIRAVIIMALEITVTIIAANQCHSHQLVWPVRYHRIQQVKRKVWVTNNPVSAAAQEWTGKCSFYRLRATDRTLRVSI